MLYSRLTTAILLLAFSALALNAYPPAPHYTLYGLVRNQVGQTLDVEGAALILLKDGLEIGRTPITSPVGTQNYELRIRIDANRANTELYSGKAIAAGGLYSLVVEMNDALFYPIEVSGDLVAGIGAERTRLDLNLGFDADGDGLPDAWEEWQLYQAGLYPDGSGVWPTDLIDRDGDFDGDGTDNYTEYVAGTFAGDASERFALEILEKSNAEVRFEFYGITGKTYRIECSPTLDGDSWTTVLFSVDAPGVGQSSFQSDSVGLRSAFVVPDSDEKAFYRLTVL